MEREYWLKLKSALAKVMALPKEMRQAYIEEISGEDGDLLADLSSLIREHHSVDRFLDEGLLPSSPQEEDEYQGRHLGPYLIKTKIGSGGMGSVYLAERADGAFDKQVAIKVIKRGMNNRAILHRFREERQILAHLEHPNIAKLLDGGTTPEGTPFFVMDYIEGLPLPAYCDHHRLTLAERLRLFGKVCWPFILFIGTWWFTAISNRAMSWSHLRANQKFSILESPNFSMVLSVTGQVIY